MEKGPTGYSCPAGLQRAAPNSVQSGLGEAAFHSLKAPPFNVYTIKQKKCTVRHSLGRFVVWAVLWVH